MNTELSLNALAAELTRRQDAKQDFIADTRKLHMTAGEGQEAAFEMHTENDAPSFQLNNVAHQQVANRLNIPTKYYDKMLENAPALLADNVNHWLHTNPENRLIRVLDGKVRAFLSDRYQRIENEEIANVVLPQLLEHDGVQIMSCAVTESRMYIKAVFSKVQGEVVKGDVVQSGIVISNSEVGQGAVKIQPLVYRLVCSNGMIIEDSKYTAKHVGGRITSEDDNIRELLSDEAVQADDRAIMLKVRDVVKASFDEARFAKRLDAMRASTENRLEGDIAESIKVLGKKLLITEGEQRNVLRHLIEGGDLSQWGLLNAVTRTAQDITDYDRATQLETLGGNILHFPAQEWAQISQAEKLAA